MGYARWFGIDRICAIAELQMLGVDVPAREREIAEDMVRDAQRRRTKCVEAREHAATEGVVEWLRED